MLRFSAHLGYLFTDRPLEARPAAAAAAGFTGIEHPGPYALPARRLAALLADQGLSFVQLAIPSGDAGKGEKGLAALPGREREFRDGLERALDYAEAVGCGLVHAMSGITPAGTSFAAAWDVYLANLYHAAERCGRRGMQLVIEPITVATVPGYLMSDPGLALRAMDAVKSPHLAMLFDAYHATLLGIDATSFVAGHLGRIAHLHVADHPGRHEPGTGVIDYPRFFETLEAAGYAGFIGCEYVPRSTTEAGLGWLHAAATGNAGSSPA